MRGRRVDQWGVPGRDAIESWNGGTSLAEYRWTDVSAARVLAKTEHSVLACGNAARTCTSMIPRARAGGAQAPSGPLEPLVPQRAVVYRSRVHQSLRDGVFAGDASRNWLIMKNGDHGIGLLQGMFERNILTVNPGWDKNVRRLSTFTDVRQLQCELRTGGEVRAASGREHRGSASFVALDPDGNPILVDQLA